MLTLREHLQASGETPGVYVADSGIYSGPNMTGLNTAGVLWVSRVPETLTEAQAVVCEEPAGWQSAEEGRRQWWSRVVELPQGRERWIVVRSQEGVERARATVHRHAARDLERWTRQLWHLGNTPFACQADAETALAKTLQRLPVWVQVQATVQAVPKHTHPGRPRKGSAPPTHVWHIEATAALLPDALEVEALRRAAYVIGTNLLDEESWPDEAVIRLYHEQSVAERGFAFLKDPLFLASSVFVKKPERIMAIAFIMVLCLLVYKLLNCASASDWPQQARPFPIKCANPRHAPPCAGFSNASKGLISITRSTRMEPGRPRSCA